MIAFDAVLIFLVPDWSHRIAIPDQRSIEVGLGFKKEVDGFLCGVIGLTGKTEEDRGKDLDASLFEERYGTEIVLLARSLIHIGEDLVVCRLEAQENTLTTGLRHQLDDFLITEISAEETVPFETVISTDHHAQHFFESGERHIDSIVNKTNSRYGPDLANSVQLVLDVVQPRDVVFLGPQRK